jgi:hypothetical protein
MKELAMDLNDTERMMQMITGCWVTQVVHAAAMFSLADYLARGSATAEDIAEAEGTDPSATTFRLLRACASLGMVTHDGRCVWKSSAISRSLPPKNELLLSDPSAV